MGSMINDHPYNGRLAAIATIHHKNLAIEPVLKKYLGLNLSTVSVFDTDTLGTFTGEIPRKLDMLETVRVKAKQAIIHSDSFIGIGSEGSFGPHPYIPFFSSGFEVLLLLDSLNNHEIVISHRFNTNYDNLIAKSSDDISSFLNKIGFPEHAVIIKPEEPKMDNHIIKGINNYDKLIKDMSLMSLQSQTGRVFIQTDMRAHLNPTRMNSLRILAKKLCLQLRRLCPSCSTPGFGRVDVQKGMLCEECNLPTQLITAEIYKCRLCGFSQKRHERNPSIRANARWCNHCNP